MSLTACANDAPSSQPQSSQEESGSAASQEESSLPDSSSPSSSSSSSSSSAGTGGILADLEGNPLETPEKVERIVSLAPSNTEILVALGLGDRIVGADSFSADAGIDESLCTLDMQNVDLETVLSLQPDVVFINSINMTSGEDPYQALKDQGVTVLNISGASSFADIQSHIRFIAAYTGTKERGEAICGEMDETFQTVRDIAAAIPEEERKTAYFEISSAPYCYSTGTGTFLNEMMEMAGLENIFADQEGWFAPSEEEIIALNPEIIFTNVSYEGYDYREILDRSGWDAIAAVGNNEVFTISANTSSRATQNVTVALKEIAKKAYPDAFSAME